MQWYWCQRHARVEEGADACRALDRLGPYPTREDAQNWRDHAESRNEAWEEQDRQWDGDDSDD